MSWNFKKIKSLLISPSSLLIFHDKALDLYCGTDHVWKCLPLMIKDIYQDVPLTVMELIPFLCLMLLHNLAVVSFISDAFDRAHRMMIESFNHFSIRMCLSIRLKLFKIAIGTSPNVLPMFVKSWSMFWGSRSQGQEDKLWQSPCRVRAACRRQICHCFIVCNNGDVLFCQRVETLDSRHICDYPNFTDTASEPIRPSMSAKAF